VGSSPSTPAIPFKFAGSSPLMTAPRAGVNVCNGWKADIPALRPKDLD
jgi:hypothetical protein